MLLWAQLQMGVVNGGLVDLAWTHDATETPTAMAADDDGSILISGCMESRGAYVAKFTAQGLLLWRQEEAFAAGDCIAAIGVDEQNSIFVAGTTAIGTKETINDSNKSTSETDIDILLMKLASGGEIVWRKTMGTPFDDAALTMRVVTATIDSSVPQSETSNPSLKSTTLYVGGYSEGDLALGANSPRNCATSESGLCEDGFVIRLDEQGIVKWIHHVSTEGRDRVFDVDVDANNRNIVIVGETWRESLQATVSSRLSNIFAQLLDPQTGKSQWNKQIGHPDAAVLCELSSVATRRRGRCSIAIQTDNTLSLTASTYGLVSTIALQQDKFDRVCGKAQTRNLVDGFCVQLIVSRLDMTTGNLLWVSQFVYSAHTTASHLVAAGSDTLVVGVTDPGVIAANMMNQLVVARFSSVGDEKWLTTTGYDGDDTIAGVALTSHKYSSRVSNEVLILGVGSILKQRSSTSLLTYVRRINVETGKQRAFCLDQVAFAHNVTQIECPTNDRLLTQVAVRRLGFPCAGGVALTYETMALPPYSSYSIAHPNEDYAALNGVVQFSAGQANTSIAVEILSQESAGRGATSSRAFLLALQSASSDVQTVEPSTITVVILPDISVKTAANGAFWRQLSNIVLLVIVTTLLLVLCIGRFCWRRCFRRARRFQYNMVHLRRRPTALMDILLPFKSAKPHVETRPPDTDTGTNPTSPDPDQQEADELRSHLEQIQQLNESLEGLLYDHKGSGKTSPIARVFKAKSPKRLFRKPKQ